VPGDERFFEFVAALLQLGACGYFDLVHFRAINAKIFALISSDCWPGLLSICGDEKSRSGSSSSASTTHGALCS